MSTPLPGEETKEDPAMRKNNEDLVWGDLCDGGGGGEGKNKGGPS